MTDAELLALLAEKTPDELTEEQIELLRRRLTESAELREALLGQVQMETYLATALARVNIQPQDILRRAQQHDQSQARAWGLYLGVPLALAAIAVGLFLFRDALLGRRSADTTAQPILEKKEMPKPKQPQVKEQEPTQRPAAGDERPKSPTSSDASPQDAAVPPQKVDKPTPVTPPPPATPWQQVLAIEQPPAFADEAFRTFDVQRQLTRRGDLLAWFEAAPGHNFRITEVDTQKGKCAQLEGLARLKAPWTADSALKLSLENYNRVQLHFYHGGVGVTLVYYEDQQYRWAAYATERAAAKARPDKLAITATDDDRCRRTELRAGGPLEIRHRGGELVLSRGDIVLLAAPLPGPPDDVYFEGRVAFHGIELIRTDGDPQPLPQPPVVYDSPRPVELAWRNTRPEVAQAQPQADGSLRLWADKAKERVECFAPLPPAGLCDVVVELGGITPGSSVYLGNEQGAPHEVLRFFQDPKTKGLVAGIRGGGDDAHEIGMPDYKERPVPLVADHCFVRLLYGAGNLRWWLSSDGLHWAQVDPATDGVPGNRRTLGLQLVANRPDTHITVKRVVLRELSGLAKLAPAELRGKAAAFPLAGSLGQWLADVTARQPEGAGASDWRRACAIQTLAVGAQRELAYGLLELLLDDAAARQIPADEQLAALHDAMLLALDLRDSGAMRIGLPTRYLELGQRSFDEQGLPPWETIRHAAMSVPMTPSQPPLAGLDENLRWELIDAATRRPPQDVLELARRWRFYQLQQQVPLLDWADAAARRELPGVSGESITRLKDGWRPMLVEDVSRDTYGALTELQSVIDSEAWDDAAQVVASLVPESAGGVAPSPSDEDLLVSLPTAVRLALDRHPLLRQSLEQQFGELAELRISQAIAAGDAAALELASVQFAGTQAAGQAHRWLGDQALASGWFERAVGEYQRAIAAVPPLENELAPRIRLAAAMQGRDALLPATGNVRIGEALLTKEQFEALVTEMRSRAGGSLAATGAAAAESAVPPPTSFNAQFKARLDGNVGDKPQEEVVRRTNTFRVPWADRQIATALEGDILYVANRFQVAAYNLASGQRLWQSPPPAGPMKPAQDWAMIPMRPLITATHIFVRQLYGPSSLLVCLNKQNGQIVWSSTPSEREFLVSDPVLVQGQLVALSIALQEGQEGLLLWNLFDPASGQVQDQRELVRLRNSWGSHACCEVTALDDSLLAALGGATACIDAAGGLRWIRKQAKLPAEEDPRWILQLYQRPLVDGERAFIAQPGVRAVESLDIRTGARHWLTVLPDLLGIAGLSADKLIVWTEKDLLALDAASGQTLWRHPAADLHSFQLCSQQRVLYAKREPAAAGSAALVTRMVWLDSASGQELGSAIVPQLGDADPRVGPLVVYKDQLWTFFGKGQHDPTRDLVELAPAGEALRPEPARDIWLRHVPPPLAAAAASVARDWQLVSGLAGDRTGLVPEAHGETNILGIRLNSQTPLALARQISLAAGSKAKLRLRVANDPGHHWKLEVRLGERMVQTVDISDQTHPDRWKTIEVDLSSLAGTSGMLVVSGRFVSGGGNETVTFWKAAELVL